MKAPSAAAAVQGVATAMAAAMMVGRRVWKTLGISPAKLMLIGVKAKL